MLKITTAFGIGPLKHVKGEAIWKIPCGLEPLKLYSDARRGHWRTLKIQKICPYGADLMGSLIIYVTH